MAGISYASVQSSLTSADTPATSPPLGQMIDDGVPYSTIGLIELEMLLGKKPKIQTMLTNTTPYKF